jgi:hypothetical protein
VFGDFLIEDVNNYADPRQVKYINEITTFGELMDSENISWEFGRIRAQVGGRLVVDVIAGDYRFLMYRSTGKGTTADTAGEWTPIPGFAKDTGWFIKGFIKQLQKNYHEEKTNSLLPKKQK